MTEDKDHNELSEVLPRVAVAVIILTVPAGDDPSLEVIPMGPGKVDRHRTC